MYKNISKYLLILLLIFTPKVYALNPGAYLFRFNNPQSATQSSKTTVPLSLNQSSNLNYQVNVGFPNLKIKSDFNFTVSEISIDFKNLPPETLLTRSNTLSVNAQNTRGYSILAYQNHPLTLVSSVAIPDWSATDSYGFGYSLDNILFQSFSDQSRDQLPATLTTFNTGTSQSTTITYQIKIPSTQAAGDYQNIIYYLALPAY